MGRKFSILAAFVACSLVSACGGGDGSSPPAAGGGGGGTTTPPPPPPPTYTKFADLTGIQAFKSGCTGFENNFGNTGPVVASRFGEGIAIQSNRTGPTYDIDSGFRFSQGSFNLSFTQADRTSSTTTESYSKVNANNFPERFTTFAPAFSSTPLEYAKFATVTGQLPSGSATLFCIYGVPTVLSDIPSSAVNFANMQFFGTITVKEDFGNGAVSTYAISSSSSTLSANPANGAINLTIDLKGRLITGGVISTTVTDLGVFTSATSIDGTLQSFGDNLVDGSNGAAGTFGGWFFGPQGKELGYSFNIVQRRADNSDLLVTAVAMATR